MIHVQGIDHVALAVRSVQRSVEWYADVLGLQRMYQQAWGDYPAVMGVGSTAIALFPIEGAAHPRPGRDVVAMRHLAFRLDAQNFAAAQRELRARGISFDFQDHQIAHSIYFTDPDGHEIELTTYDL